MLTRGVPSFRKNAGHFAGAGSGKGGTGDGSGVGSGLGGWGSGIGTGLGRTSGPPAAGTSSSGIESLPRAINRQFYSRRRRESHHGAQEGRGSRELVPLSFGRSLPGLHFRGIAPVAA